MPLLSFFREDSATFQVFFSKTVLTSGAGEMAQWLKALAVLAEDLSLILNSHVAAQSSVTPVPEVQRPLLAIVSPESTCSHDAQTHM